MTPEEAAEQEERRKKELEWKVYIYRLCLWYSKVYCVYRKRKAFKKGTMMMKMMRIKMMTSKRRRSQVMMMILMM